ncbi:hypothetical protein ACS0TY_032423 [Phlomoides rotata]
MADKHHILTEQRHHHVSVKTAVVASIAGLIIGGPLIGLMGITFAATMTLLLVTSPLFIIFSPVLFGAACVFATVMLGFGVAGAMAVAGVSSVVWILRSFTGAGGGRAYGGGGVDKMMESGSDWGGPVYSAKTVSMLSKN